jgi:ATP phosphoribosyltransferase regulatory subunit
MNYQERWLLPAGITESLPEEAIQLETLRHKLLNLYGLWGYQLVIPPMIEFLESLLVGAGQALDLQTFKLTDQFTGRLMGIRADMTPQVARIDAHCLKRDVPTRLCYLGTVLHTRHNHFVGSRSPLQLGAELFGYQGIAADIEILSLMIETLSQTELADFHVDVGHVEIYRCLMAQAKQEILTNFREEQWLAFEEQLFQAIKRRASAEVESLLCEWKISPTLAPMLRELPQLNGDSSILTVAEQLLAKAPPSVLAAINELKQFQAQWRWEHVPLHFDLAELRGYSYHTGVVFAAYAAKHGRAIAKGGRYDIGKVFGRSRPATGFSVNLRTLITLLPNAVSLPNAIFASAPTDSVTQASLMAKVNQLRQAGERVICGLPNQSGDARAMGCARELRLLATEWQVVAVTDLPQ